MGWIERAGYRLLISYSICMLGLDAARVTEKTSCTVLIDSHRYTQIHDQNQGYSLVPN